jgi:hypothetical protein
VVFADLGISTASRGDTGAPPSPSPAPSSAAGDAPKSSSASTSGSLQQDASNPIGNLTQLPFQYNMNFGVGPDRHVQDLVNFQPVVPFELSTRNTLLVRTVVPILSQPTLSPGMGRIFGIGDVEQEFFFVPTLSPGLTIGVGPIFLLPTSTDVSLGGGKLGAGAVVAVVVSGRHTLAGFATNNVTSFAGERARVPVNQFLFTPIFNYFLPHGITLGQSQSITANWAAPPKDRWTVPVGATVSQLTKFGSQAVSLQIGAFYNVVRPIEGPSWTLRTQFVLLFPNKRNK